MKTVEAVELLSLDVFNAAEQIGARVTFRDVERHLERLASHRPHCPCGRPCGLVGMVSPEAVYHVTRRWQSELAWTRARALR